MCVCVCVCARACTFHIHHQLYIKINDIYVIGSEKRGLMAQTIDSELTIPR